MNKLSKAKVDSSFLYAKLKYKQILSERQLVKKHPQAAEYLKIKGLLGPGKIREHATKLLASGALAGSLLLASPVISTLPLPQTPSFVSEEITNVNKFLVEQLSAILPKKVQSLTTEQEAAISHLLYKVWGLNAVPSHGGTQLNQCYGLIGAEQHLPRYPGDTLPQHGECLREGMTPGLGAWGYFAKSKDCLTEDLILKEKYYVAVQTLYLPDWYTHFRYLRDLYKYRKVVVVNPINGKTIVCDVADAGPSWWTGKHFGGSPEVMAYLSLNVGMQKGPVVLFFVDDPEDKVPLGPLEKNLENTSLLLAKR